MTLWRPLGLLSLSVLVGLLAPSACSASGTAGQPGGSGGGAASGGSGGNLDGGFGCNSCLTDTTLTLCDAQGNPSGQKDCSPGVCVAGEGCLDCHPGTTTCVGNEIHKCDQSGKAGSLVKTCDLAKGEVCNNGACTTECDKADGSPSNVGCEFWAVDLPNTRGIDDASKGQWGVVLSNAGHGVAQVTIEANQAAYGQPRNLTTVQTLNVAPGDVKAVGLPRAEVTGWTPSTQDPPGPPGTFLSSKAFRITSTVPLVVYQFNNFTNNFSNDASLLLPRNGLGTIYRVLGYPTANPISVPGLPQIAGIPDHSNVTVVGIEPDTHVTVIAGTKIRTDTKYIPNTPKGGTITAKLGSFDVLNLASDGMPGDMTGTVVQADKPIVVFSGGERGLVNPKNLGAPPPPGTDGSDVCCTDHLEEQVFPVTAMGKTFVVSRSPVRSTGGYTEPDVLRFMGVASPATVTTNLPAPFDSFTLQPGEMKETWTDKDIVVQSTQPIAIGQLLVSAGYTTSNIGDPSLTIFPPVDQYRKDYVFLIPPSWSNNYFVIAAPTGGTFKIDGAALPSSCVQSNAGQLGGKSYETYRCPLGEGAHNVSGSIGFGLMVYGYGNVGSYAFAGGANVKKIYTPPPIK